MSARTSPSLYDSRWFCFGLLNVAPRSSANASPSTPSMMLFVAASILAVAVQQNNACFVRSILRFVQNTAIARKFAFDNNQIQIPSINDENVDIRYWNSYRGYNDSIKINYGHEDVLQKHWIPNLPLKVIIHGWLDSTDHTDGVFSIKMAYLEVGGYNVITVNWGGIAGMKNYMLPMMMTSKIGTRLARVLDNIVTLDLVTPEDIHLIGHSLGAHIAGACGSSFTSGVVGRITGLDPAGPGFEFVKLRKKGLKRSDARFVDVIHTSGGSAGCFRSMGHADFFPNGGSPPQPGCYEGIRFKRLIELVGCSHSRAYRLYEDSIYNAKSLMGVQCSSWKQYQDHNCDGNRESPMGHDALPHARGDFYLWTENSAPFAISDSNWKEDL